MTYMYFYVLFSVCQNPTAAAPSGTPPAAVVQNNNNNDGEDGGGIFSKLGQYESRRKVLDVERNNEYNKQQTEVGH